MTTTPDDLTRRALAIELLILDVDGVLTDGVIAVDDRGVETKHFHVRDGAGIAAWRALGKPVAILSGRKAPCVEVRAAELGISRVIQGAKDKKPPYLALLAEFGVKAEQVCHVGDDLADLPLLEAVGLAACPADAAGEVVQIAHLVTIAPGGRGAVREVVEKILKIQGGWDGVVARSRGTP